MWAILCKEKFNELGFRFTQSGPDVKFADPETLKGNAGVDVFMENGFYLIEQTGDTVQITIPEGFKARDW